MTSHSRSVGPCFKVLAVIKRLPRVSGDLVNSFPKLPKSFFNQMRSMTMVYTFTNSKLLKDLKPGFKWGSRFSNQGLEFRD